MSPESATDDLRADDGPSDFSILRHSLAEFNSLIYGELSQRIPSIGLSDDSSGSDSESLEVVFSRRVSGKPSLGDLPVLPTTRSANPASGVESLEGKASEQDPKAADLEAEDGVAGRIECSYGGAGHAGKATPAVGPSSSTCCAKPEGQAACRTGVAEGRVPGGEQKSTHLLLDEDNPLGVPPLTMEGWLSGAAGRLASQRNFARKTADGELYDGAADEEDQEGDAMAVAQAESAFHAVISRPVEDVVAEEVASLGTPGHLCMDLESAISGMDLDGLLQRLKRDGHGAPASGDQAGMELKWNLPPAESLFSSDDEAADTKAEAAAEPRSDGAARIQHSGDGPRGWPEQPSSWSARGRRRSLGPPRGRLAQPTQPRSEPPATVLLDLRAAHDEATGAESPAGHVRDPSEENAISDSSSGDDGLEGFYATRRRHGQWEGASHSRGGTDGREGVSPHRRVLARGRSRAQTGRGATAHPKDSDVEEDTTPRQSRDAHVSLLPAEAEEPAGSSLPTSAVERDMQVFGDHDLCAHQGAGREVDIMADLGVRAASKPQGGTEMLCMQKDKVKSREAARAPDSGAVHCVEEPGRDAELGTRPPAPSRNSAEENVKPTAMDEEARRAAEAEREASRARIKEEQERQAAEAARKAEERSAEVLKRFGEKQEAERKSAWLAAIDHNRPKGSLSLAHQDATFASPLSPFPIGVRLSNPFTLACQPKQDASSLPAILDWATGQQHQGAAPFEVVAAVLFSTLPASSGWLPTSALPAGTASIAPGMTVLLLGCKPCDAPSTPDAFIEQVKSLLDKAASDDGIGCHLANRGFLVKNGIDDRDFEGSLYSTAAFKADDSSESAVAVLNHALEAPGRASQALISFAENGLHVAGLRAVYLSPAQVRDLSHRTRHHPAPLKPVLAVLVRGADATGRLQQVVGLSDPQLAAETEPDSLHGRLAIRIGALLGPLVTGSKDAASARFEAAFFFGGRLFPCPAALPHPGSAVAQADVSTAILADIDQLWILAPGGTQQEMIAFLQVIEELGSRGASVQHLRKVVMSEGLLKPLSPQSRVFGGGDWCREGSPVFVACLSAEGLSRWGEPAVSMVAGKLACCCKAMPGTHQALQQMCDSKPVIPKAVALHGTRLLDDCGQPTSGEMRDAQQLAVVAMSASSAKESLFLLRKLLQRCAPVRVGPEDAQDVPDDPMELLAVRRCKYIKDELLPCFWSGSGVLQAKSRGHRVEAARRFHQPVILAVLRGTDACSYLRETMLSTTTRTYSGRASAPNCLLAICSGIDAARPVVEEYFQDSDFCRGGGVPSPSGDGPLKSALNPACQETTCCFVDLGALKHGVLQRLLKAAAKNYFSLEELGTLRCSAVQRLLPPSSEWRWESDKQSEGSAVVVFLRRVSAVLCCARMAAGAGLVKPGPTSIPSNQPEFIFGHGVAMLARGAIPTEIERCLKAKPGPSARSGDGVQSQPVQASSCLMQTTCLAVLPTKVQNRDAEIQADAAIDPGSLADILRSVHDNGFQVVGLSLIPVGPAVASLHKGSLDARAFHALQAAGGQMVAMALSRLNGIGKLQMLVHSNSSRFGSGSLAKFQVLVSTSAIAAEQQLACYFGQRSTGGGDPDMNR